MKRRRRWIACLMALAMLLTITACENQQRKDSKDPVQPTVSKPLQVEPKSMFYLDGRLYYSTERESDFEHTCGTMDGSIETTVDKMSVPTEEHQSNFGAGYGYQFVAENAIDVLMDGSWIRFECAKEGAVFGEDVDRFAAQTAAELLSGEENYCYSPISLYYALSMAATGAAGTTQKQMYDLLGAEDTETLSKDCAALLQTLHRDEQESKLYLANSVWTRKDIVAKEAYQKRLKKDFSAELFQVEFNRQTNQKMTNWVKEQTKGLLAPEFQHNDDVAEVLLNTIYYKDAWREPFYESATEQEIFTDAKGVEHTVPFMHTTTITQTLETQDYTKASLEFMSGGEMVFVLPKEDVSLARLLSKRGLQNLLEKNGGDSCTISWSVPEFEQKCQMDLIPMLETLGIRDAFGSGADFSAASETPTFIGAVEQGTSFSIDENGVEAAAYTEIAKDESAAIADTQREVKMNLNRPFLYAVRNADGTMLFIGVCEQPTT